MKFIFNDGVIVEAKSKLQALKERDLIIYWDGNHPYGVHHILSKTKVKAYSADGEYGKALMKSMGIEI